MCELLLYIELHAIRCVFVVKKMSVNITNL